jgi:hypothetical protein
MVIFFKNAFDSTQLYKDKIINYEMEKQNNTIRSVLSLSISFYNDSNKSLVV